MKKGSTLLLDLPLQFTCVDTEKWLQTVSKHCHTKYAPVPGHPQREAVSVSNLVLQTPVTAPGAAVSETGHSTRITVTAKLVWTHCFPTSTETNKSFGGFSPRRVPLFCVDPRETAFTTRIKHTGILQRQHSAVHQRSPDRHLVNRAANRLTDTRKMHVCSCYENVTEARAVTK